MKNEEVKQGETVYALSTSQQNKNPGSHNVFNIL